MDKQNMDWLLSYWDDVICQWFDGHIEERQWAFLNEKWLNLNDKHMPEPYWGNPEQCSIVIANYNPGGGADRNRHTYKDCAYCPDSFINQVKRNGYRKVATSFPIIDDPENKDKTFCWWKEYGGRKWWLSKMKWLEEIGVSIPNYEKSSNKPFVIEFCGWHSVGWQSNACSTLYEKKELTDTINRYFIKALVDAIHNSDTQIGLCIGSQFFYLFDRMKEHNANIRRIDNASYDKDALCHIHLFRIDGKDVLVMWGKGRSRYPKNMTIELKEFIQKHLNTK